MNPTIEPLGDTPIDPRVRRTRQLLFDALRKLLFEKRFSAISVQDIAERATVNRATFYAHFEDKHALLESMLQNDLGHILRERLPADATLTHQNLRLVAEAVFQFLGDTHGKCPAAAKDFENLTGTTLQEEIYALVHPWIVRAPGFHPGKTREAVAAMVSWTIFGAAHRWSHGPRKRAMEAVAEETVSLLLP